MVSSEAAHDFGYFEKVPFVDAKLRLENPDKVTKVSVRIWFSPRQLEHEGVSHDCRDPEVCVARPSAVKSGTRVFERQQLFI